MIAPSMTRALLEQRLHPPAAEAVVPRRAPSPELVGALQRLSERERQVLAQVAQGASNAEIARRLRLSETTVRTHLSSILGKISATNRVQAAVFAYESGFLQPGAASER